jgi:hypothetical protein
VAAAGEDEKEEVIQMPRGRGFGWWGFGWGPGWGRGNPYPFCRRFPGLPRWWWAYPYAYGMGSYMAGMPYGSGVYPTAGAPYYPSYRGYPTW